MKIDSDIKKNVAKDYITTSPELSIYSKTRLYKILGPVILGIELLPDPYSGKLFRPYFVCYALSEDNINDCFNANTFLQAVLNKKNSQFDIQYGLKDENYEESLKLANEQFGHILNGNVLADELFICKSDE